MKNTTKELSTVQRLNRLPVGTCIRFKQWVSQGHYVIRYAEKIEAQGYTTTYGRGKEPFWACTDRDWTYYVKTRIPSSFEVVDKEYLEIRKLEDRRDSMLKEIAEEDTCEQLRESMKRKVKRIENEIEERKARLNSDQDMKIA